MKRIRIEAHKTRARDVDFQALHVAKDTATVRALVIEVAGLVLDDGLIVNTQGARAETIRDEDEYSGVRVTIRRQLSQRNGGLDDGWLRLRAADPPGSAALPSPRPTPRTALPPRLPDATRRGASEGPADRTAGRRTVRPRPR